ncbi:stalk domain-containing protein [Paenibacillus sp. 2TAB19]|uniref:stalk domain-containing protein n=1 Tax=Paenibacillus sp. 2TAB19 TaxID=3233003 RepID=UPI003F979DD2
MKRLISAIAFLLTLALLPLESSTAAASAKTTMITSLPLTGIIDIFDRGNADHFYALHSDGTIWIGNGSKPAVRGPQIPGAVEISGNLILTSAGEVWSWDEAGGTPKRIAELSGIRSISSGGGFTPINLALNDKGEVYAWGNTCLTSLIRPDFQGSGGLCQSVFHRWPTPTDDEQASIPKFAIEGAKAIKASTQYILILMADGKTIKAYGNTANVTYSMYEYVSNEPIVDFDGYDKDYMGMSTMFTAIPDEFSKFKGNYVQISQGYGGSYKLLLHKDGTVWGNTIWNDDPIKRITPLKDIIEVAAVALNSGTALDKYGKVWTWGDRINIPLLDTTEKIQTKVNAIPLQKQISLRINGKFIASDPGPIQTNGTTFVPIRSLFESIGAKIGYNNDNITFSYRKQLLAFKVYDTKATLDGKSVVMPAASLSYQGRTYVPLRFLAQAFGAKVQWNNNIDGVDVQFPAAG